MMDEHIKAFDIVSMERSIDFFDEKTQISEAMMPKTVSARSS
jgi:hypothetical protein